MIRVSVVTSPFAAFHHSMSLSLQSSAQVMSIHLKDFGDLCALHLFGSSGYATSVLPNVQGLWDALELGTKALRNFQQNDLIAF